jgi:hypothetical protein
MWVPGGGLRLTVGSGVGVVGLGGVFVALIGGVFGVRKRFRCYINPVARPRSANPKHNNLSIRLTDAEAAALDAKRGGLSRSAYLRTLLNAGSVHRTQPTAGTTPPEHPIPAPEVPQPDPTLQPPTPHAQSVAPTDPIRHFHRYENTEQTRYVRGTREVLGRCVCGKERWD